MRLLNDEEIQKETGSTWVTRTDEKIAKAQHQLDLKDFIELLEDDYILVHDVKDWGASGRECNEGCRGCAIWQSLKQLVEWKLIKEAM